MHKIRIRVRKLGDALAIGLEWVIAPFLWLVDETAKILGT